jgi:alanine-synthesizing transaminase
MPVASIKEISAARRLDNVRYAIRDLAVMADDLVRQGKKILYLNIGDPNIYDFKTPAHLVEAVAKAMRDNKNGYAPSPGIPEAIEAIRNEAVRKGISSVQDVFVSSGASEGVDASLTALLNPGRKHSHAAAGLPSLFRGAVQVGE